jgi:hypothetical protein
MPVERPVLTNIRVVNRGCRQGMIVAECKRGLPINHTRPHKRDLSSNVPNCDDPLLAYSGQIEESQ